MVKEKNLSLKKGRKNLFKRDDFRTPTYTNNPKYFGKERTDNLIKRRMKEKNLTLKKVRRNSKTEADLNPLNLKNIAEIGAN